MQNSIDCLNICRTCTLPLSSQFYLIYNSSNVNNESNSEDDDAIAQMLIEISSIPINRNDGLSDKICENCLAKLKNAYQFQQMCIKSYDKFKEKLQISVEEKLKLPKEENVHSNEFLSSNEQKEQKIDDQDFQAPLQEIELKTGKIPLEETAIKENFENLKKIEKRKSLNINKCSKCDKIFIEKINLRQHMRIHNNFDSKTSSSKIHKCPECNKDFKKLKFLSLHIMKTHKDAVQKENSPIEKIEKTVFTCQICHINFTKLNLLKNHEKSLHKNSKKINKDFKCDLCSKTFRSEKRLVYHMSRHNEEKTHKCHICNKIFQQSCTLKDHIRTHTGEQPFLCSECGKAFNNQSNLRQHQLRHSGIKSFQCTECPSKFISKGGLKSHMATHSKIKPFICDICGSSFTKSYSLAKHKRIHTGEKPYSCDVCDMRFNSSDHVKRHKRIHTGEKPYKCKFCDRAFAQSNDLIKHLRCHIGEKTYQCYECLQSFRLNSELKDHIREHFIKNNYLKCDNNNSIIMNNDSLSSLSNSTTETASSSTTTETTKTMIKEKNYYNENNTTEIFELNEINEQQQQYRCENCSLIFNCLYDLQQHDLYQHNYPLNSQIITITSTATNEIIKIPINLIEQNDDTVMNNIQPLVGILKNSDDNSSENHQQQNPCTDFSDCPDCPDCPVNFSLDTDISK